MKDELNAYSEAHKEIDLDPRDWEDFRHQAHALLDRLIDGARDVRSGPTWRPVPADVRARIAAALPEEPEGLERALHDLGRDVLPYPYGTLHPRFFGWVNGSGLPVGMLGDLAATAMNSNVGAFDHSAVYVEETVLTWLAQLLDLESGTEGILTSGGSMANLLGVAAAINARAGFDVRRAGLAGNPPLTAYASLETHMSIRKAVELCGIGSAQLRELPVDAKYRVDVAALRRAITRDREAGYRPFLVVGNAGTVSTGATDDLDELADVARDEELWLHVDGAFGALAWLVPGERGALRGLQRADSIAFDLHKWLYLSNDVGCVLVREPGALERAFEVRTSYLVELSGGLAVSTDGSFKDKGIELTRRFRALKVWLALKEHGAVGFRNAIAANLAQARRLAALCIANERLELLAPAPLNVVCFRYTHPELSHDELDELNRELLVRIQERGISVPSHTILGGTFALRVSITNHRTRTEDVELLARETIRLGDELVAERTEELQGERR